MVIAIAPAWAEPTLSPGQSKEFERLTPELMELIKQNKPVRQAGAEVLLSKTLRRVDEQLLSRSRVYVAIAIHDAEAARDYSQIKISFNDHFEDFALDFAQVLTPEGRLEPVAKDAVQVQSPSQEGFFQDTKIFTFSLPNVRPGAVLEFQYEFVDTKPVVPGMFFSRFGSNWWQAKAANQGGRLDPVVQREIVIDMPAHIPLHSRLLGPDKFRHKTKKEGARKLWIWQANDLPEVKIQGWMPRGVEWVPKLMVSTDNAWQTVVSWSRDLFLPHLSLDDNLKAEVALIKENAQTTEEKVREVYALLDRRVRYVFAHVGRGGYEPHSAPEVLKRGYGDCKDQTILAVALLNALDVEAYPALVVTRDHGKPNLALPGVYFNHMVTYIPEQEGANETWLDTTGESQLYPGSTFYLEDQPALIISEATQSLTQVSKPHSDEHWVKVKFDYKPPVKNEPFKVSMSVNLGGVYEQNIRSTWLYSAEKEKVLSDAFAGIFSGAHLNNLKVINANALGKGVIVTGDWTFDYDWEGLATKAASFNISQLLGTFAGVAQWHNPQEREQPFEFDPGLVLDVEVNFLPAAEQYFPEKVSSGPNINNSWFSLAQASTKEDNIWQVSSTLKIKPQVIPIKDYKTFYQTLLALQEERGFDVVYTKAKDKVSDEVSPAYVRQLIADGKFDEALEISKALVEKDNENGEFHYMLGLAQGYNNLLGEAAASFDLAERLEYVEP